jgi:hypothetical protein
MQYMFLRCSGRSCSCISVKVASGLYLILHSIFCIVFYLNFMKACASLELTGSRWTSGI